MINICKNALNYIIKRIELNELYHIGSKTKYNNNDKWKHILKCSNYNCKDITINSNDIKLAKEKWINKYRKNNKFEARLLCKQDTNESKPDIFKKLNINILSVRNGSYLLTKSNIYYKLKYDNDVPIKKLTYNNHSSLLKIGNSETNLTDNLIYCKEKILESIDFLNEDIKFKGLLSGRHRCNFETILNGEKIKIQGSQYETDECCETLNRILIIEAKKTKFIESFKIRQLYFPFRTIYDKFKEKKEIINLFINQDNKDIIHIWKFKWKNPLIFDDLECIGYYKYKFS